MSTGIILVVRLLSKVLFAKDFYAAWPYSAILVVAAYFQCSCGFLGTIYTTALKTKMIFITTMTGALVNTCLNFILIPRFGGFGAAFATFFSYFVVWLFRLIDSRKILKLRFDVGREIVSYLLLFAECLCMTSLKNPYWISGIIVVSIWLMNYKFLTEISQRVAKRLIIRR
jgi:O-antigen/teichoic acid export membrane protein